MRPQMVMALDNAGSTTVTTRLVQALGDSDRGVREQAAMGLAITPAPT
jgi:HEAT repeat protein